MEKPRFAKAEETKQRILDVSLELFIKEGYDRATMRSIAGKAKLSAGAAYYYFPTKEHIVFHYYEQSYAEQLEVARSVLQNESRLDRRIAGVIRAHMEVARPYHAISRMLFKIAADPSHPISPFSSESASLRQKNIELFAELIEGSSGGLGTIPKKFKERLPELLWLYKMGIILYWIHDSSPEQEKTFRLIDQTSTLVSKVIALSRVPGMGTLINKAIDIFEEFKPYGRS